MMEVQSQYDFWLSEVFFRREGRNKLGHEIVETWSYEIGHWAGVKIKIDGSLISNLQIRYVNYVTNTADKPRRTN